MPKTLQYLNFFTGSVLKLTTALQDNTVGPGSCDPFYVVNYYIKLVTTSWTHSMRALSKLSVAYAANNKKSKNLVLRPLRVL